MAWTLLVAVAVGLAVIGAVATTLFITDLPDPNPAANGPVTPSTLIYDRKGRLLYEIIDPHGGKHQPIPLSEIPAYLQQATVATEDATFYANPGLDPLAIVRAIWINLRGGEILSGGSTITQQVARNLLLSAEERSQRTLSRKLRESILAYRLARTLSKEAILELYLNTVYYGNLSYGVQAASQTYFAKPVGELDLSECAMLAGLPQAPAVHDPLTDPRQARIRQSTVLDLMTKAGYITPEQARAGSEEPLAYAATPFPIRAPHFVMYVWELLRKQYGEEALCEGGLQVYTTLDLDLQDLAQHISRHHLAQLSTPSSGQPAHNVHSASVVALDPQSGEILAMVGSPDYFDPSIDGAVNVSLMPRQPGSAIKPLTYAAAFSDDLTPAMMLLDVPCAFTTRQGNSYVPVNYDHTYHGPVLLREALGSSLNVVAVRVLQHIGVDELVSLCHQMGITTLQDPERYDLALTLGGGEVRLLELTAAYATFATGGLRVKPQALLRVEQPEGEIWAPAAPVDERVIEPHVAYWITDVLADNSARIPAFGESSFLALTRPAAVKTGTTTDWRDNWTVGYTPQLAVGVWVGNADNSPMVDISGVSGAAPIWNALMELALRSYPVQQFSRPPDMVEVEVCADSGKLPGPYCPHRRREWFPPDRKPKGVCSMHRMVQIDRRSGQLATPDTPSEYLIEKTELLLPADAAAWVAEHSQDGSIRLSVRQVVDEALTPTHHGPGLELTHPHADSVFRINPAVPADLQRMEIKVLQVGLGEPLAVVVFVDGKEVGAPAEAPYTLLWQLEAGTHVLYAEAMTSSGESWRSEPVRITVLQ